MGTFSEQKNISTYWYNNACDLRASAAAIDHAMSLGASFPKDKYGLSNGFSLSIACPIVYRMLWGMALEALLKAVVIEKSKEIQFTHNLIEFSVDADVEFSEHQKKLLKVLSEAIIWHGRYPVPKKEEHWDNYVELSREVLFDKVPFSPGSSLKVYTPNDSLSWESLDELWNLILLELANIAKWITTK